MSRVYFHTPSDEAELKGRERAWAGCITSDMGLAALGLVNRSAGEETIRKIAAHVEPAPHRLDAETLALMLRVGPERQCFVLPDGSRHGTWQVLLNTCIDSGSNAVRLLARIHAQCEIHAWVDGPDRAWLADEIAVGRASGIFRADVGWEDVATMLRRRDDEPVVMSYSVCEQFPNRGIAGWQPPIVDGEPNHDAWYDLPDEEQWSLAMRSLRTHNMQITPDNLATYKFGTKMNAYQVVNAIMKGPTT